VRYRIFDQDRPEYVQHILRLLDVPEEAQAMGRKGTRRIESGFLWDHQIPQLLRLYKQVLGSGDQRAEVRGQRASGDRV
jgi:glycosyltransferase involved in cell wall biosynthesis